MPVLFHHSVYSSHISACYCTFTSDKSSVPNKHPSGSRFLSLVIMQSTYPTVAGQCPPHMVSVPSSSNRRSQRPIPCTYNSHADNSIREIYVISHISVILCSSKKLTPGNRRILQRLILQSICCIISPTISWIFCNAWHVGNSCFGFEKDGVHDCFYLLGKDRVQPMREFRSWIE